MQLWLDSECKYNGCEFPFVEMSTDLQSSLISRSSIQLNLNSVKLKQLHQSALYCKVETRQ